MAARAKDELQLLSPGRDRARIPPGAGQRLALFPGSFKPPHRGHLAAVQSLLARPDVDRVVIIVSNRCRLLPGTRLVIDASTAAALWRCLTADLPNVAVEIAKHTAIEHALAYFGRVRRGDSLLFCIGENDLAAGDDRFDGVIELRENTGVAAGILTANSDLRATDLRRLLAFGDRGRREFLRALPESMPNGARRSYWTMCRERLRPVIDVYRDKVCETLRATGFEMASELRVVDDGSVDPAFEFHDRDGNQLLVKYAGDSVGTGQFFDPYSPRPRRRLAVEKRALNHVHAWQSGRYAVPETVRFERRTRTLVLRGVPSRERCLAASLSRGRFDAEVAARIGETLARIHGLPLPDEPFWGDHTAEVMHWRSLYERCTAIARDGRLSDEDQLAWERSTGTHPAVRCVLHLDFRPENIRVDCDFVTVAGFERASSHGDPAHDLGTIAGHYLARASGPKQMRDCIAALIQLFRAYRSQQVAFDPNHAHRALAFAAITLITASTVPQPFASSRDSTRNIARTLLSASVDSSVPPQIALSHLAA